MTLREKWNELRPQPAGVSDPDRLAEELIALYSARTRRAYGEDYLEIVLSALDSLVQLSTDPTAVRLAAWFHRAEHLPGGSPAEDAEASARLAERRLPAHGIDPTRTVEVARLIRRTGDPAALPDRPDANGDVLLDAVNAHLAADPAWYAEHAAELRRASDNRDNYLHQRYAEVQRMLTEPLFRTPYAEERMGPAARENLRAELDSVDSEIPAPWRGWSSAALTATATFGSIAAAAVAAAASGAPWQVPVDEPDSMVFPVAVALLSIAAAGVLFKCAQNGRQRAGLIAGTVLALSVTALLVARTRIPVANPVNGVGLRVPLLITALILVAVASAAAIAGSLLRARTTRYLPPRNHGQQLSWFAVAVVIALVLLSVVQPVSRAYLLNTNEWVRPATQAAGIAPKSVLNGQVSWANDEATGWLEEAVATKHGIALAGRSGVVEMLDPSTGEIRWRYTRSDTDSRSPELYALRGGELVLADFPGFGKVVLDAATGRRTAAWPRDDRDQKVQNADPLITGESFSSGSDKLRGVDENGRIRWTYEPERCAEIKAAATAGVVVGLLSHECGSSGDELAGLDVNTGKQLWQRSTSERYRRPMAVGDLVVAAVEPGGDSDPATALVGIDARSGAERWRWKVPQRWACRTLLTPAGRMVIVVDCPGPETRRNDTAIITAIDSRTGRTSWQHEAPIDPHGRVAVTTDGRVVTLARTGQGCQVSVVSRAGYRQTRLPEGVTCSREAWAFGNQVFTAQRDGTIVALR
ncbi:outer membrane protein assembly factor BamB family protein [Kribbella deserti]|uniref:PQQ-binding-like beta-propeller repeat protein n=1 Tax=Kribbella deserti TaxID=1926257 RepID=A0ABV6QW90_9ACTN